MYRWRRGHRDGGGTGLTGLLPGGNEALLFAAAVFVLNATPGVDLLLTVTRTLAGGARAGLAAAVGINAGCVVHALAAAFGLAALLAVQPQAFRVLQWAGAAYLAWLGLGLLRQALSSASPGTAVAAGAVAVPRPLWADFRTGLVTNVLNPKVALFFLAFLPQFVPAGSAHKTASFLLLGGWFVLQSLLFLVVLVWGVARLARASARVPMAGRARRVLGGAAGLLFITLALRLLASRPAAA